MADSQFHNVGKIYTSKEAIKKDTPIKIEVFDADEKVKTFDETRLGLRIYGTVKSLMEGPYYCGPYELHGVKNCLEVVVLWQNERKKGVLKKK